MNTKVKLKANLVKNENGVLLFDLWGIQPQLETDMDYTVEIKPFKSNRSLNQNALAWQLIGLLEQETNNDKWDIYCSMLEKCNQEAEFILALPEAKKSLEQVYRVVKQLDETRDVNGKTLNIFKCYLGSSKFDSPTMNKFIDCLLQECAERQIYV